MQRPVRVGCVDAGSNALRIMVVEFRGELRGEAVHYDRIPVRLGQGVFDHGRLDTETMDNCVAAFAQFARELEVLEVDTFRAVTTSAVREAANGELLRDRIRAETGIDLQVISAPEEARLVQRAVASTMDLSGRPWIIVDLGGGSLEISLADVSGIIETDSYAIGSVRLLRMLEGVQDPRYRINKILDAALEPANLLIRAEGAGFIATGGNIDVLAELAAAPTDEAGVRTLETARLTSLVQELAGLSLAERVTRLEMRENRADVIVPAAWIYLRLAELAGAKAIQVPGVGVKDGVLLELLEHYTA